MTALTSTSASGSSMSALGPMSTSCNYGHIGSTLGQRAAQRDAVHSPGPGQDGKVVGRSESGAPEPARTLRQEGKGTRRIIHSRVGRRDLREILVRHPVAFDNRPGRGRHPCRWESDFGGYLCQDKKRPATAPATASGTPYRPSAHHPDQLVRR
jgi:hypothetical protein